MNLPLDARVPVTDRDHQMFDEGKRRGFQLATQYLPLCRNCPLRPATGRVILSPISGSGIPWCDACRTERCGLKKTGLPKGSDFPYAFLIRKASP